MNDYFNIPNNELSTRIFYSVSSGATSTNEWQIWQKPKNCKFVYFIVIGGGAGGGGGASGGSGTARNGGGGGASSSVTKGLFPANVLPDILYIKVGVGGSGGNGSSTPSLTAGGVGGLTYVSSSPNIVLSNLVLISANTPPNGGASNGAGTIGTVFTQSSAILSYYGVVESNNGNAGGLGGTGGGGAKTQDNSITCGGAAGAGATTLSNSGGVIARGLFTPSISGGAAGNNGFQGISSTFPLIDSFTRAPLYFTGGSGGGSNNTSTGGNGGNGSYGSGGGGGGAGTTGGRGGKGGDGLVIITSL